ncbi:MAG: YwiC-like family protein [Acidobacteria bacterium]|nr:YwiC-like family protein [Acidobacteriota bacterium]
MVSLPFLAGAVVGGEWASWRVLAALLAVFSVFLLREPLLFFWRQRAAIQKYAGRSRPEIALEAHEHRSALFSLLVCGSIGAIAGAYLLTQLPWISLFLLGSGATLLTFMALYFTVRNQQRHPLLQIASVIGLTASSLLAYLAAHGFWAVPAFWVWGLCAAHSTVSVLIVHGRLETMIAARSSGPVPTTDRRNAWMAQSGLGLLLVGLAVSGRPWLLLAFLPPFTLHCWELWHFRPGKLHRLPMRRVGWMQLTASTAFCLLLIMVLR